MRFKLFPLIVLLLGALADAAVVQSGDNFSDSGNVTVALTGTTSGNWLVVVAIQEVSDGNADSVVSTTVGTTSAWTTRVTGGSSADAFAVVAATATVSASGNVTVQATPAGATWVGLYVVEVDSIDSFDSAQYARDTTSPFQTAATTPGSYDAMAIAFGIGWFAGAAPAVDTGWTSIGTGTEYSSADLTRAAYQVYTSGDAQASFTAGSANSTHVVNFILIESEASGTTPLRRRRSS